MASNMQSNWESPQWDMSQDPLTTPGQPDPADQAHQQALTHAPTWEDFGHLIRQFQDLSTSVRDSQQINTEMSLVLSDLISHIQNLPHSQPAPLSALVPALQPIHNPADSLGPKVRLNSESQNRSKASPTMLHHSFWTLQMQLGCCAALYQRTRTSASIWLPSLTKE
ncbi:hypothetical protein BDZ94DRAFT_1323530 [Collybia nuda]|uniref:Uncharacterized protein n=1 Tax=Collybia nuda TaxID=64659 RepID=A0A9P5Y1R9_9AGAR|nr:hypothetical protein BDZ94DRAFT_1323530 [Collybia nuda]